MTQQSVPGLSPPDDGHVAPKTSTAAIVSLVVSILGFCTAGLGGLVGLALGIVALVGINRSEGRKTGGGLAIAGICVGAGSTLMGCLLAGTLLLPAIAQARFQAGNVVALSNLRDVHAAMTDYAADHDGALPTTDDWVAALDPYMIDVEESVTYPIGAEAGRAFAMNASMAGARLDEVADPEITVLLFEVPPGSPTTGGKELLDGRPRTFVGYAILFADGTAENLPEYAVDTVVWQP